MIQHINTFEFVRLFLKHRMELTNNLNCSLWLERQQQHIHTCIRSYYGWLQCANNKYCVEIFIRNEIVSVNMNMHCTRYTLFSLMCDFGSRTYFWNYYIHLLFLFVIRFLAFFSSLSVALCSLTHGCTRIVTHCMNIYRYKRKRVMKS